jgi:DNA primase
MKADSLADALAKGRGIERPFRCEAHDDHNASASVNSLTGLWVCYACGAAGKADENATIPDAETLLGYLKGDTPVRTYADTWLDVFDSYHPSRYWAMRFGDATATHFRCGTHPLTGRPTYPMRNAHGHVIGVVTRQEDNPKYLYPYGVSTSKTFFGDIQPSSVLVLVEGAADVMALHQSGIPTGWSVLGCYGAGVHAPQVQIITDLAPRIIVTAFDNDAAGANAAQRATTQLGHLANVINHVWDLNDPGDMAVDERITAIQHTLAKENA